MNSSPASSQISRSSCAASARMRVADCLEPARVELDALPSPCRAARARAGARSRAAAPPGRAPRTARAAGRRARATSTARCGQRRRRVDGQPALLGQLVQRVAAARGVEQVGGDLGVEGEVGRDVAQRLGVVGDHRAVAGGGDQLGRIVDRAGQRVVAARVGAEAPAWSRRGISSPSGISGGAATRASSSPSSLRDVGGPRPRATATSIACRRPRAAGSPPARARPAPPRAGAAGRAARSRGTPRAAFERSISRVSSASRSMSTGTSRTIVASCLEMPRVVGVVGQVLLALGAGDLVDAGEHGLEVAEALQQVGRGLVADARDAGDVVRRVALEAVEVGDLLRRDAVAVDHALAVVDLRLGDPARGAP